jgi:ubiquinone/menaquinone biosynthesis C-methylase UbiE
VSAGRTLTRRIPAFRGLLWKASYEYLAKRFGQANWTFMNYGFVSLDPAAQPIELDEADEPNRRNIQLYRHAIGSVDVAGRDVLEVGSGRGGGSSYIMRYLKPRSVVGVDFSPKAVDLCNQHIAIPGLTFKSGAAEALPFDDESFDVVVNIESSHCYQSMDKFLAGVQRVLRPGGYFVLADFRSAADLPEFLQQLSSSAMTLVEDEDITANVFKALEADSAAKLAVIDAIGPGLLRKPLQRFSATEGTQIFDSMRSGETTYLRCLLHKPA